jgi:hypothetical protein
MKFLKLLKKGSRALKNRKAMYINERHRNNLDGSFYYDFEIVQNTENSENEVGTNIENKEEPLKKEITVKKSATVLLIENTEEVRQYEKELKVIINKILNKKDSIAYVLQIGQDIKKLDVFDSAKILDVVDSLLLTSNENVTKNMLDGILEVNKIIDNIQRSKIQLNKGNVIQNIIIEETDLLYLGSINVTKNEVEDKIIQNTILKLRKTNVKTKCLCLKDSQCVAAAYLGFESIGHLISDFYL